MTDYHPPKPGDRVHYWAGRDVPPLSSTYEKPPCKPALITEIKDDYSAACLGVLHEVGELIFHCDITRQESFATTARDNGDPGQRSYGVGESWHVDCGDEDE